jgi:probable F420-dependent oxidoreductase
MNPCAREETSQAEVHAAVLNPCSVVLEEMTTLMKFGIASINSGYNCDPERMGRLAQSTERAGFDSIWAGGHPFLSEKQTRMSPSTAMLDPIVALTFIAARTQTVRLGTGILLLPQLSPVIAAKQLASLDFLSRGRLIVGVGVGWSDHEYEVLGIPFNTRGRRNDDYLKAMKALWGQEKPAYHGRFISFDSLRANPRPVQQPNPPIVMGGLSEAAYRRAVEQGNGWFGFGLDVEAAERALAGLREASKKYPRPVELGELEITVAARNPVDVTTAQRFSELGVHRLCLIPPQSADETVTESFVETARTTLIGQV